MQMVYFGEMGTPAGQDAGEVRVVRDRQMQVADQGHQHTLHLSGKCSALCSAGARAEQRRAQELGMHAPPGHSFGS